MANMAIMVSRVPDSKIVSGFLELCEIIGATGLIIREYYQVHRSAYQVVGFDRSPYDNDKVFRIFEISIDSPIGSISLKREDSERGPFFDKINTSLNANVAGQQLTLEKSREIQDCISVHFITDDLRLPGLFRDPKIFEEVMVAHHQLNTDLRRMAVDVGNQVIEARVRLEEEFAKRVERIESEKSKLLSEKENEYLEKLNALEKRGLALDDLQKELDDRSNTHARRELHRSLKDKISVRAKNINITNETKLSRVPIHVMSIVSMGVLSFFVYITTISAMNAGAQSSVEISFLALLKPVALTVALLGLLAWYLRWLNRWFERYADSEFQLKQFELDIDRASWVVEAALEWRLSQDKPMPEHLLETISRNLFLRSEKDEGADMHPGDYLASALLGRASGLNLKVPGGELSYTARDLKKLNKES